MTWKVGTFGTLLLAACSVLPSSFASSTAQADSRLACAAAAAQGSAENVSIQVTRSRPLYRFQRRPYLRIPTGVSLHVRAPQGMTAADLYNLLVDCKRAHDEASPLCVQGAAVSVDRVDGGYVVNITSDVRSNALEIQHRAERLYNR